MNDNINNQNNKKTIVGFICGGRSFEHALSISSIYNIISVLDTDQYRPVILYINSLGDWYYGDASQIKMADTLLETTFDYQQAIKVTLCKKGVLIDEQYHMVDQVDTVFPMTNGIDGHQGAIPGMMKLLDIPCVGSDMFETVVCIDKEITKSLLENHKLPIVPYLVARDYDDYGFEEVVNRLGLPFIIKPCRLSSSAGVSKVSSKEQYQKAIQQALKFDTKFLIEMLIIGREIEVAVIGNDTPKVSDICSEVITDDFYCYESKFSSKSTAKTVCPTQIKSDLKNKILQYSKEVYQVLECKGFARIDFFVDRDNAIFINEATTLPLFTNISLFPKMWGEDISSVVSSLIDMSFTK